MVVSSAGPESTVYTFRPGTSAEELTVLTPQAAQSHDKAAVILPVNWWNNGEFKDQLNLDTMRFTTLAEMFAADASTPKMREYLSQDGSVFLPAGRVFQQGPANDTSGWRFSDNLDTYGFIVAEPGQQVYVSSESEDITYSAMVKPDGTLAELKPFAQRGGESVAVDRRGNVYSPMDRFSSTPTTDSRLQKSMCRSGLCIDLRRTRPPDALHPCASRIVRGAGALTVPISRDDPTRLGWAQHARMADARVNEKAHGSSVGA